MIYLLGLLFAISFVTGTGAETVVMAVLGVFGTAITQWIKKVSGADGTRAFNYTVAVSVALAVIGGIATNAFSDAMTGKMTVLSIINGVFVVTGVSTMTYKWFVSTESPTSIEGA